MARSVVASLLALPLAIAVACGGGGDSTFTDGADAGGDAPSSSSGFLPNTDASTPEDDAAGIPGTLEAVVRDFKKYDGPDSGTNPDFENVPSEEDRPVGAAAPYFGPWTEASPTFFPGASYAIDIVEGTLGADNLPVYNGAASFKGSVGRTATTHGKAFFDQWYRDVPGINVVRKVVIQLTKDANGVYSYDSAVSGVPLSAVDPRKQFFPIDDGSPAATSSEGFGNQSNPHNYHFTVELRTKFVYQGKETFRFSGDDDVFVFINKKLVINIGGIHGVLVKEVKLPDVAEALGLVVGKEYPLDFFQAERHVIESNLRIDTTLELAPAVVK